jgi:hypothetical protein
LVGTTAPGGAVMAGEFGVTGAGVTGTTLPAAGMALEPVAVDPGVAGVEPGAALTAAAGILVGLAGMNSGPFCPQPDNSNTAAIVLPAMRQNMLRRRVVGINVTQRAVVEGTVENTVEITIGGPSESPRGFTTKMTFYITA